MKLLLTAINAKYIHSCLAVYDLAAYCKDLPAHCVVKEYTINQQEEHILQSIYEEHADIIAFSCYLWNISTVTSLARELKKVAPHVKIWLGGPEVSYDAPSFLLEHPYIDMILCGEGEETFRELICCTLSGSSYEQVCGITYRTSDDENISAIRSTPPRPYIDMDRIPFIYEDFSAFVNKIIYYETSRGCPFSCSYCLSSVDKRVRFRSLSLVLPELQKFLDARVPQVKFVDRTFNCRHEHAYAIWSYIKEHDNGVTNFHFEISADLLKEEDFLLFETMRPGLIQLEIGVQSTNPETITAILRSMQLAPLKKAVARIHSFGNIHQHLDLIAGLPNETYDQFRESFNEVYAMQPDQLQLGFLKVLKGSYMAQHAKEYDLVTLDRAPYEVLSTRWLSYDDVLRLKGIEEMVEIYYNSGQFSRTLSYVLPFFDDAISFYETLASYYKGNNLFDRKHTRLMRYEILRDMLTELQHDTDACLDEYLIADLYATERIKKRPLWAASEAVTKDAAKQLKDRKWRQLHLTPKEQEAVEHALSHRTELHLEQYTNTLHGDILLYNYSSRHPLTNEAERIRLSGTLFNNN